MEPSKDTRTSDHKSIKHALTDCEKQDGSHHFTHRNVGEKYPAYILRMPRLIKRLGVARATVYDWMNPRSPRYDPTFPVPIKLSRGGAVGWIESEVDSWLASRERTKRIVT